MKLAALALLTWIAPAWATDGDIVMSGLITHKDTLTRAKVMALPKHKLHVTFITGRGEQKGAFTGGSLWDALQAAQVVDQGKNSLLRRTITVEATDGYTIVFGLAELDPDYGNAGAILAYERDGKPMEGAMRLVFPRDRHGGRAVTDVAKIDDK